MTRVRDIEHALEEMSILSELDNPFPMEKSVLVPPPTLAEWVLAEPQRPFFIFSLL